MNNSNRNNIPLISVITVTLNSERFLSECIKSVASQDYPNLEHIIIDGGSTDGTLDIIKNNSSRIAKWISEKDDGIFYAMNKGISLSTGEYITFLNSDDYYFNNSTFTALFNSLSDEDIIYGDTIYIFMNTGKTYRIKTATFNYNTIIHQANSLLCHQSLFVKKNCCPFYNTRYKVSADLNWYYDILKKTGPNPRLKYLPQPIVYYRRGGYSDRAPIRTLLEWILIDLRQSGIKNFLGNLKKYIAQIYYIRDCMRSKKTS